MLGYNAISRYNCLGLDFDDLESLLWPWRNFLSLFRHLGVTFGALWMHFSCQKTDWGAKGAPRGASTIIPYHIWVPFWIYFPHFFGFSIQKVCTWYTTLFFSQFLWCTECSWGWAHMQSVHVYAVQTHFSLFACFLKKGSLKSPTWVHFGTFSFVKNQIFVWKEASKNASKKVSHQIQTRPYP